MTMIDVISCRAIITCACLSLLGGAARAQPASEFFARERSLADRVGVQQRGPWLFSTAIDSATQVAAHAVSQRNSRVRRQAELQLRTALLDLASVPEHVSESLVPILGALAWASTGRAFDLTGVQEVYSQQTPEGGYRVVVAVPRQDDIGSVSVDQIVVFLERDVAQPRPAHDPLLLIELIEDPVPALPRVLAAMGRLYGPGMLEALSGVKPAWSSLPAWVSERPRAMTEGECEEITSDELLKIIASRPEDATPRRVLGERMRVTGLKRIAGVFLQHEPTLEWKRLNEQDEQAIGDIATLSGFLGLNCNWLELLVRTRGRLPWKHQATCDIDSAKGLFAKGAVKPAGVQFLKTLEAEACPEAMSYLASVCHEAKAHRLGASLARWALELQPSLPFAAINEIRNLMKINDRPAVRACVEAAKARQNLNPWERAELDRAIRWLKESPTPSAPSP